MDDLVRAISTGDSHMTVYTREDWEAKQRARNEEFERDLAGQWKAEIEEGMAGEEFEVQIRSWDADYGVAPEVVGWTPTSVIVVAADQELDFYKYVYRFPRNPNRSSDERSGEV